MPTAKMERSNSMPGMLRGDWLLIAGLTLLHLLTFINKPPHIDDTLYLETARGILEQPARPLTNEINWEMIRRPIYLFAVNPPLYNYQQAVLVKLFGWNIAVLHVLAAGYVFLAAIAMFYLARRFTPWPRAALMLLMLSPTLMPQTNLMLDVPGMALVAATVAAWIKGVDERSNRWMCIAGLAATAAFSTKYNSAVVLPLVALYSVMQRRWTSLVWLAMPLAGLGVWRIWNAYILPGGAFHLTVAKERFDRAPRYWYQQLMLALMSWGSGFIFLPAYATWAWLRCSIKSTSVVRIATIGAACVALVFFVIECVITIGPWTDAKGSLYGAAVSLTTTLGFNRAFQPFPAWKMVHWPEQLFFVGNALFMLTLLLVAVFQSRDHKGAVHFVRTVCEPLPYGRGSVKQPLPYGRGSEIHSRDSEIHSRVSEMQDDLFLLAWIVGMTLFNCLFAPHHAPRYYFPAYPAMALLLIRAAARFSDQRSAVSDQPSEPGRPRPRLLGSVQWAMSASIALQAVVGLILVASDNTFARASQDFAERLAKHPAVGNKYVYYVGHWGFQYHAQKDPRFRVIDVRQSPPPVGGLVAVVMDTGWGEFPRWLKKGPGGFEQFTTESDWPKREGGVERVKFRIIEDWDVPHPWPLQTVSLDQKLLLYSPRFYHNRLPYGFGSNRSHRMVLLERFE